MKKLLSLILIFLFGCGGTLTDEQRKKAQKDMADHAIKKVSEAQIIESAFEVGRAICKTFERKSISNSLLLDSLQKAHQVKISKLSLDDRSMRDIEKQIVEAYVNGSGKVELDDNVQKLGADSILYTKPVMRELPDGSLQFNFAIGVRLSRRMVVLSIK